MLEKWEDFANFQQIFNVDTLGAVTLGSSTRSRRDRGAVEARRSPVTLGTRPERAQQDASNCGQLPPVSRTRLLQSSGDEKDHGATCCLRRTFLPVLISYINFIYYILINNINLVMFLATKKLLFFLVGNVNF